MQSQSFTLSQNDLNLLAKLRGRTFFELSGEDLVQDNLSFGPIRIGTSGFGLLLSCIKTNDNFSLVDEPLNIFKVDESQEVSGLAKRKGFLYFNEKGLEIESVLLIQDTVEKHSETDSDGNFKFDRAIVLQFDSRFLAFAKDSYWEPAIRVIRGKSIEEVEGFLRDLEDEWPSDLLETYEFKREWVKL